MFHSCTSIESQTKSKTAYCISTGISCMFFPSLHDPMFLHDHFMDCVVWISFVTVCIVPNDSFEVHSSKSPVKSRAASMEMHLISNSNPFFSLGFEPHKWDGHKNLARFIRFKGRASHWNWNEMKQSQRGEHRIKLLTRDKPFQLNASNKKRRNGAEHWLLTIQI